jgi:tetratricopeptide (TPR) repeat protein
MLSRPQPIGVHPFPAGLLLLPASRSPLADAARGALLRGAVPDEWPPEWEFYRDALDGQRADALAALARAAESGEALDAAIAHYNRFVLSGDGAGLADARDAAAGEFPRLAELAAYIQGAGDDLPEVGALEGELAASVRLAQAAWHLERNALPEAIGVLELAVAECRAVSPVLAAQLQSQRAQLLPDGDVAILAWRDAITLAGDSPLPQLRADLCLGLAMALQATAGAHRQRLVEAVNSYQDALHAGITLEDRPETYALVQNNLGLAYLSMPMTSAGDKIRLAVAVQSFKEALKVYTQEAFPEQWSSAMLNMANALQYLPSSHPQENLIEAVNGYESLLQVRDRALDPVGYARLLANQANALGHLGMFAPALEKLNEARKLLSWHGEDEAAAALLEQVERINEQMALARDGSDEASPDEAAVVADSAAADGVAAGVAATQAADAVAETR